MRICHIYKPFSLILWIGQEEAQQVQNNVEQSNAEITPATETAGIGILL